MDSGATGDRLYLLASAQVGGFRIVIKAANGTASVMTVKYWNGSAFTTTSATDGTASGGALLAATGNVTWTVPTDEVPMTLNPTSYTDRDSPSSRGFYYEVSWSVALDADTEIEEGWTLPNNTNRGYFRKTTENPISFDLRQVGSIDITAGGADTMDITWKSNV